MCVQLIFSLQRNSSSIDLKIYVFLLKKFPNLTKKFGILLLFSLYYYDMAVLKVRIKSD
jgi:hypothetical protein